MDNRFEPLAMGEVLSIDESAQILIGHRTFRVSEFAEAIRTQLEYGVAGWTEDKNAWFSEKGIPCEVLRFSSGGWQKGKVRINLEFCPHDQEDEKDDVSTSLDTDFGLATPTDGEDELDLGKPLASETAATFDDELALTAAALASEVELDQIEAPVSDLSDNFDEALDFAEPTKTEDEQDRIESSINQLDELDLGTPEPAAIDDELEQEDPTFIYVEMEQEALTIITDETLLDTAEMPANLDDDFDLGEISESIEQELELVENPEEDELLDLSDVSATGEDDLSFGDMSATDEDDLSFGDMSATGEDDLSLSFGDMSATDEDDLSFVDMSATGEDDLDFGDISSDSEDEFRLDDISLNNESENNETDSLLDDVWQDMNEATWQNK